jgi:hypothetical protein
MENFKLSYKGTKPQKNAKLQKAHWCFSLKNMLLFKNTKKNPKNILKIQKAQKKLLLSS